MSLTISPESERLLREAELALSLSRGNVDRGVYQGQDVYLAGAIRETTRATALLHALISELMRTNDARRTPTRR